MWKATDTILALVFCLLVIGGAPATVSAQVPDSVRQAAMRDFHGEDLSGKDGPLAKAGMDLLLLYHARSSTNLGTAQTPGASSATPGETGGTGAMDGMQVRNGRVAVEATAAGDPDALVQDLESLGATRIQRAGSLISAHVSISRIPDLARLTSLNQARPARAVTGAAPGAASGTAPGAAPGTAPGAATDAAKGKQPDAPPPAEAQPADTPSTGVPSRSLDAPEDRPAVPPSENDQVDAAAPSMEEMSGSSDRTSSKSSNDAGALLLIALAVAIVLFLDP